MTPRTFALLASVSCLLVAATARAQSRPLVTADPEPVGAGRMSVDLGVDIARDTVYPLSGLKGTLVRYGTFDLNFGVSSIADILLDGGFINRLSIDSRNPNAPLANLLMVSGTSTKDVEDGVIGARVKFLQETAGRPAVALRFTTRLPNSKHDSGLGNDTMDFSFGFLFGKTIQRTRIVANAGWSILEDAVQDGIQNDVITYGASVVQPIASKLDATVEINGRFSTRNNTPPVGTEGRSMLRGGVRVTHGNVRYDAGLLIGLTSFDPSFGVTGGVTWNFHAFSVP